MKLRTHVWTLLVTNSRVWGNGWKGWHNEHVLSNGRRRWPNRRSFICSTSRHRRVLGPNLTLPFILTLVPFVDVFRHWSKSCPVFEFQMLIYEVTLFKPVDDCSGQFFQRLHDDVFFSSCLQSLVIPEKFQHILRVLNTNIDGRRKIAFAITAIKVWSSLRTSSGRCVSLIQYWCHSWVFFFWLK